MMGLGFLKTFDFSCNDGLRDYQGQRKQLEIKVKRVVSR